MPVENVMFHVVRCSMKGCKASATPAEDMGDAENNADEAGWTQDIEGKWFCPADSAPKKVEGQDRPKKGPTITDAILAVASDPQVVATATALWAQMRKNGDGQRLLGLFARSVRQFADVLEGEAPGPAKALTKTEALKALFLKQKSVFLAEAMRFWQGEIRSTSLRREVTRAALDVLVAEGFVVVSSVGEWKLAPEKPAEGGG